MENKTGKYFKYAIGEIVLVVIGIVIALQINNWNEIRKERKQAFEYLSEFKKDIISDTVQYNFVIAQHQKNIRAEIALLKKIKISIDDIYNIGTALGATYYSRKINNKTFQKTQNTGNSNLLGFEDLYDQLSNYYTETSRDLLYKCEWEVKDYDKNFLMFDDFMDKNNYESTLLRDNFKQEFKIDSFPNLSKNQKEDFILEFINSVKGRNYIRAALNRHYYMRNNYKTYRSEAKTLLYEIDKAMKSNDQVF